MNKYFTRLVLPFLLIGILFLTIAATQQPKRPLGNQVLPTQQTPITPTHLADIVHNVTAATTADLESLLISQTEWHDPCATKRMEISGIGMGDIAKSINPQTISLANPDKVTWLLAQVAGRHGENTQTPESVTLTSTAPQSLILNESSSNSHNGYTFEASLQPADQITALIDNPGDQDKTPRGLILYAKRDMGNQRWTSVGKTMNKFVYQASHLETLTFTPLTQITDLLITAVIIDNQVDTRPLILKAAASNVVTHSIPITWPTHGPLLNIVHLRLPQVLTGTDQINITLESPPSNGDSVVLVGLNVSYLCTTDEPPPGDTADLAVTKTVSNPSPNAGDIITYTVTVINNGPDDATGIQITDKLLTGLTFSRYTSTQGTYNNANGLWVVGELNNTASATLTIVAKVNDDMGGQAIPNIASLFTTDQTDLISNNNVSEITINVSSPSYSPIYLPIIFKDYELLVCNSYDFNVSPDGWLVDDKDKVITGYTKNKDEYFIHRRKTGIRIVQAPVDFTNQYTVEVDIRWDSKIIGYEYGLIFAQLGDADSFTYRFGINPDPVNPQYRLRQGSVDGDWKCLDDQAKDGCWNNFITPSLVQTGSATNHLKVKCDRSVVSVYINDDPHPLWERNDKSCRGRVGVFVQSYPNPNAKAYFDNFRVSCASNPDYLVNMGSKSMLPVASTFADGDFDR